MTVDLACGELAFVDLTFAGLDAHPAPGEERHARDLVRTPGGAAITAIGAARLGLRAAITSPLGSDEEGDFVRRALADEGVKWAGRLVARTAVTAVLPSGGDRAMATFDPGHSTTAQELAAVAPDAVVIGAPRAVLAPHDARVYATYGDADARRGLAGCVLDGTHAMLVNAREARLLTGRADAAEAARALAEHVPCAVVTLGAQGALAVSGETLVRAPGVEGPVVDTTGAGDLFGAAYVWADLGGVDLELRLRWAVLYAALSVAVAGAVTGAARLADLLQAGERRGLAAPEGLSTMSMTRRNA